MTGSGKKGRMTFREEIEEGLLGRYSRAAMLRLHRRIGSDPERFAVLARLVLSQDADIVLRASWLLTLCAERTPSLLLPWIPKLITAAARTDASDALRRNIVRSLQFIDIPRRSQGRAAELCFGFLQDAAVPIAAKAFSMTVLANIARSEPDLKHELVLVIEQLVPYGSAGIRSRARKVLNQLRK
ncbi:MAG: hypothetical protein KBF97_05405 [Bacteroidetes bacterium]|nr:hypothetical protein [Bacteroidota bacterium]